MGCHDVNHSSIMSSKGDTLVLVGNPNVGKSVFFNALTGVYVDVSNFPGTTVDISSGRYQGKTVMDTPGVYGVSSFNDEERVARDVILYADVVLNVVDALHLERDLFLTQQIIDMNKPVIVALNMMDEVKRNGISIDISRLSEELGVPVIPTTATKGEGIDKVKESLSEARLGNAIDIVKNTLADVRKMVEHDSEALLVLEEDENILSRYKIPADKQQPLREDIYKARRKRVDEIVDLVITESSKGASFRVKLGRWMLSPLTGIPMLAVVLWLTYLIIGVFVAQTIVGFTEGVVMGKYYYGFIMGIAKPFINVNTLVGQLLVGEFGVFTMAPIYLLGLLLPLVVGFYFILSVLEDSGYLPRIAALVDRLLIGVGLNGRAVIPMILGFGCVTMATITTRLLGSKRERFIATMLLGLAIPCSAQLGVIVGLIAPLGINMMLLYLVTVLLVFIVTGTVLNKIMPGESTHLMIDLPPIRLPQIQNVAKKTWLKAKGFIMEAGPLFVMGAVIITLLKYFGALEAISNAAAPVTVGFLKLPKEAAQTFIMGIIRRDFGAAGLTGLVSQGLLNPIQVVVALVAITLFVPCIAAIMVIFKERDWKESVLIWVGSFVISFLTAGTLAQILL